MKEKMENNTFTNKEIWENRFKIYRPYNPVIIHSFVQGDKMKCNLNWKEQSKCENFKGIFGDSCKFEKNCNLLNPDKSEEYEIITLNPIPDPGDQIWISPNKKSFRVKGSGNPISGQSDDLIVNVNSDVIYLVYVGRPVGWSVR